MKKTKLFGTRIIENIQVPRTPKVIMFDNYDSISNMKFDEGDLLDANSIKKIIKKGDSGAGGSYNTDDLNAAIKALEKEINVLPIDEIVSKVGFTYNTKIDKFSGGVIWDEQTKKFYAVDNGFYYTSWSSYDKYPSSDIYNGGETKIFQNIFDGILYRFSNGKLVSISSDQIHIGPTAPEDKSKLWIDTSNSTLLEDSNSDEIKNIKAALTEIYNNMEVVNKLILHGVVAGNSTSSAREVIMSTAQPIKPEDYPDTQDDPSIEEVGIEPNKDGIEPTVNHISVKMDTAINFAKNKQNLIDGEILFYTDRKKIALYKDGIFNLIGSTAGGSSTGGISVEDLYATHLEYLKFTDGTNEYKVNVSSDGSFNVHKISSDTTGVGNTDGTWGVYVSHLLNINEVYCGGNGSENCMCSHNFVELANASEYDINLNGIFLLYTDCTLYSSDSNGYKWQILPLSGIIKAGSTYLIRGAKCNQYGSELISVPTYDQEWYVNDELIKFSQEKSSFYLCVGSPADNWVYNPVGELYAVSDLKSPWVKTSTNQGYIDSCGFGTGSVSEGTSTFVLNTGDSWDDALFVRWFMFDPSKQANKAYASRQTTALWTYINLSKQEQYLGNSVQYYYPDYIKAKYQPKSSWEGKNFFSNKTQFNPFKPNCIRCTFGIQATYNDTDSIKASRCFNWVSVGYYNEFVEYRKIGTSEWSRVYSITDNNSTNSAAITKFIDHYKRLRWKTASGTWVTTHKVVLSNVFQDGVYEYRVGRDGDNTYYSNIKKFTVYKNSDVSSFTYVQDTDEQGFNWQEYQAWSKTAQTISKNETFNFLINTGDITQSGNRENEWLDYYCGLDSWVGDKEQMFTIGNNDLCGHNSTQLTDGEDVTSKYNHINVLRYFTFELDPNFDYIVTWKDNTYPIYSLYSFNFGKFHFVSINSETAAATSKVYTADWALPTNTGDATFAQAVNAKIEEWLLKDLQKFTGNDDPTDCKNVIVYMHEMPFTIVTWDFMSGSKGREGSHLNTLNANGLYRFSRLFKKYGIRLVMGGHKHTYSISKPIYDAPSNYITASNLVDSSVDLMGDVTSSLSRIPIIQVTRQEDIDASNSSFARYELVSKINAPTYVMSQSSGYKLISNKEQPSGDQYQIPWLLSYFKAKTSAASPTENMAQHFPMYIVYNVSDDKIKITAKQVHGVWDTNIEKNSSLYNMNSQLINTFSQAVTLSPTIDSDKSAYGITDITSYTITL